MKGQELLGTTKKKVAGRKPGTENSKTKFIKEVLGSSELLDRIERGEILGPLAYLIEVLNDPNECTRVRVDASKALLPYTNQRLPMRVEQKQVGEFTGYDISVITKDD